MEVLFYMSLLIMCIVVVYCFLLFFINGLILFLFFMEFFLFLELMVFFLGKLLIVGDFNFVVNNGNDGVVFNFFDFFNIFNLI